MLQFFYLFYEAHNSDCIGYNIRTIRERKIRKDLEETSRCLVQITSGHFVRGTITDDPHKIRQGIFLIKV